MKEKDFDKIAEEMQNYVDARDQEDFSSYALSLGKNPYHRGHLADGDDIVSNSWRGSCGDQVTWFLQIQNDRLVKVFYETDGCTTSSIVSSQTAKMIDNKTIEEARSLTDKQVLEALGKFPKENYHCATLAVKSLNLTLDKYEKIKK